MPKPLTTEQFVQKAKEIFGDAFDYSRVVYVRSNQKVELFCNIHHGGVYKTPNMLLSGYGCKRCNVISKTLTTEEVIMSFKEIHGDTYDYSRVIYQRTAYPVQIVCRTHGMFSQTPNNHLKGQGCKKCFLERKRGVDK